MKTNKTKESISDWFLDNTLLRELKDTADGYIPETLESAGCDGQCPGNDADGLPDCGNCSQGGDRLKNQINKLVDDVFDSNGNRDD